MQNTTNHLNIIIRGGLNQLYTKLLDKFTTYYELFVFFLKQCGCPEENLEKSLQLSFDLSKKFLSSENYFSSIEFSKKLEEELLTQLSIDLSKYEFKSKDFMLIEEATVKDILEKVEKIYVLHEDPIFLYLENKILNASKLDSYFNLVLSKDQLLDSEISRTPKNFIFFDFFLDRLFYYHQKGCWTVYLTHYVYTSLTFLFEHNPYHQQNQENLKILKAQGRFFDFSVFVFYQIKNYFSLIIEVNKEIEGRVSNQQKLEEKLNQLNPIRVLVLYRFFFKKLEYLRAKHFNSNERVLFSSYVGSLYLDENDETDFSLNGKFNCILFKINEKQDLHHLKRLIHKLNSEYEKNKSIIFINSLQNLDSFLERHKMIVFLQKFCESEEVKNVNEEFGLKVQLPRCFSISLSEVLEVKEFKDFLFSNEIQLPIIIKYTGPRKDFNHLMITICNEEGINNYVEFMKNYAKGLENDINLVIQSYVNHGGYVIKLYFANSTGYCYFRPSLPDVCDELIEKFEEYKLGYYKIATDELLSKDFVTFWEKLYKNEKIKDFINLDYMIKISKCFQHFSKTSLFGLDFLYDYKNKEYYLIDCNLYPGYKELLHEFNGILTNHICDLYGDFTLKQLDIEKV